MGWECQKETWGLGELTDSDQVQQTCVFGDFHRYMSMHGTMHVYSFIVAISVPVC